MKTYAVSLKNQLINAWPILIFLLGALIMPFVVGPVEDFPTLARYSFAGFIIVLVPHLAIHLRYLWVSRGRSFSFDRRSNSLRFDLDGRGFTIPAGDIVEVKLFLPRSMARNTLQWFPWQGYCYAVIKLRTEEQITITSLQDPMLQRSLKATQPKVVETMFGWPPASIVDIPNL